MSVTVTETKYKVPAASKLLGLSEKTLWQWIAAQRIGVVRLGRSVRIPESSIAKILEEGYTPARTA